MSLPKPAPTYDQNDQAQTRAQLERALALVANLGLTNIKLTLQNAADDTAAAAAGVHVGALYRNGSVLMVRVA